MWKNKESYVDEGGVFDLSIIKHVTLQKLLLITFGTTLVTILNFFLLFVIHLLWAVPIFMRLVTDTPPFSLVFDSRLILVGFVVSSKVAQE